MSIVFKNYQVARIDFDTSVLSNGENSIGLKIQTGSKIEHENEIIKLVVRFEIQYVNHQTKDNIFKSVIFVEYSVDCNEINLEDGNVDSTVMADAYKRVKECIKNIIKETNVQLPEPPEYQEL